jgi:hypothetical protein
MDLAVDIFGNPLFFGLLLIFILVIIWGIKKTILSKTEDDKAREKDMRDCVITDLVVIFILWIITILLAGFQYWYDFFVFIISYGLIHLAIVWLITYFVYKKLQKKTYEWHLILILLGIFVYIGFLFLGLGLSGSAGIG